jgi:hypothetical protein
MKCCKLSYKKNPFLSKVEYETGSYGVIVLTVHIHVRYTNVFIHIYLCTGCAGKNLPSFGRSLLMIKENDEEVLKNEGCYTFLLPNT